MEIRALRPSDDRASFHSGDEALDRFFHHFAGQNQFRHYVGVTYVATDGDDLLGFATVAPAQLEPEELSVALRKKFPNYHLPVLRLGRLAVDHRVRGRGLGKVLVKFVCQLGLKMADEFGCAGIVVDAKPAAVDFYAKLGFVPIDAAEGQSDARPRPTAMFLAMRAIKTARDPIR